MHDRREAEDEEGWTVDVRLLEPSAIAETLLRDGVDSRVPLPL